VLSLLCDSPVVSCRGRRLFWTQFNSIVCSSSSKCVASRAANYRSNSPPNASAASRSCNIYEIIAPLFAAFTTLLECSVTQRPRLNLVSPIACGSIRTELGACLKQQTRNSQFGYVLPTGLQVHPNRCLPKLYSHTIRSLGRLSSLHTQGTLSK